MTITKEDIEKSICEYNEAIKKLEDAGINYDNYTVTISHTRWIKLLTILKTHVEAWEKVKEEIKNYDNFILCANGQKGIHIDKALEIIDKYKEEKR